MSHPLLQRVVSASFLSLMTVAALSTAASAQYTPITVSSGFTTDDVYNGTAADTTVGYFDYKNTWAFYSVGANTASLTTGLPTSGTITSSNGTYQLQSYLANNALQISPALTTGGTATNTPFSTTGTLTLSTPTRYSSIGILSSAANGNTALNVVFNYVGGSTSTATYTSNDWFGSGQAYTAGGRVKGFPTAPSYELDGTNPGIYETLIATNSALPLQSVTFTANTPGNQGQSASIFAISGVAAPEPGSVALAGMGLLGIVAPVISRRRK